MQRFVDLVLAFGFRDLVDAEGPLLACRQGLGFELLAARCEVGAVEAALVSGVVGGLAGLKEEGAVVDLFGVDAGCGRGGVGAGEKGFGNCR